MDPYHRPGRSLSGHLNNINVLRDIASRAQVNIQYSGGVRNLEHIETLLALGVQRVVLGVTFLRDRNLTQEAFTKYGERILPGVDARDGMVAIEGFKTSAATEVGYMVQSLQEMGVSRILYTDLRRIGSLRGANLAMIDSMVSQGLKVHVAGGVNSYETIQRLKEAGVEGVIIGKAIYTGAIDLPQALGLAKLP